MSVQPVAILTIKNLFTIEEEGQWQMKMFGIFTQLLQGQEETKQVMQEIKEELAQVGLILLKLIHWVA